MRYNSPRWNSQPSLPVLPELQQAVLLTSELQLHLRPEADPRLPKGIGRLFFRESFATCWTTIGNYKGKPKGHKSFWGDLVV